MCVASEFDWIERRVFIPEDVGSNPREVVMEINPDKPIQEQIERIFEDLQEKMDRDREERERFEQSWVGRLLSIIAI